jgi:K+ transporter
MERIDIARIIHSCAVAGLHIGGEDTTYYSADPQIVPRNGGIWNAWRRGLFVLLKRNARSVTASLGIPADALAKLGVEVPM